MKFTIGIHPTIFTGRGGGHLKMHKSVSEIQLEDVLLVRLILERNGLMDL